MNYNKQVNEAYEQAAKLVEDWRINETNTIGLAQAIRDLKQDNKSSNN